MPTPRAEAAGPDALEAAAAPLLDARSIDVILGGKTILRGASLTLRAGECVALLGPNGAGKSTLLRCCAGLTTPARGTVEFAGCSAAPWPTALGRRAGLVFQKHQLVPQYCVLTNVVHGRLGFPEGWRCCWQATAPERVRRQAMDCLRQVDLAHKALQPARSLSGGESQRVAIARVLIREPELIFADEPTASLDPVAGQEIFERLHGLTRDRRVALLIATHDVTRALRFADRVVGLRGGEVIVDGPTSALSVERLQRLYGGSLPMEGEP